MSISYEDAEKGGMAGRALWAIQELGRNPSPQRVYYKANSRLETRDHPEAFKDVLNGLIRDKVLLFRNEGLSLYPRDLTYRLRCQICGDKGPEAKTETEAVELARVSGWSGNQCPAHAAEGVIPENRQQRRKREREQRKFQRNQVEVYPREKA